MSSIPASNSTPNPSDPQIAAPTPKPDPDPSPATTDSAADEVGATIVVGGPDSFVNNTKQDLDLAFAMRLLRSGRVTERQFTKSIADWTIHGATTLNEHLTDSGVITAAEANKLMADAFGVLEKLQADLANDERFETETQISRGRMSMIDPSSRVVRLLGLADGANLSAEQETRQTYCQFTLIRKLGEGGLGTVWLARDENLRRYVAIKEIRNREGAAGEAAIARFRREAEITGRLEHPGIVPIYQMGHDPKTGKSFYAMRFLGKRSMQDSITEYHERRESGTDEPVQLHRLLTGFANLCKSVAHAHSKQVIHRDLKPENVALDNFGQVVLLDWGLARLNDETQDPEFGKDLGDDVNDTAEMTMVGEVLGSPMYMAPEQAAGRQDDIDERTDVYGLGGILFSILTGDAPHERSQASIVDQTGPSALLTAIVTQDVPEPRSLVSTVPPRLNAICVKAMAKKRYLRYSTARALAEDMERYMAGGLVSAYQSTTRERIRQWVATHPRETGMLSVILAVCGLMLGMATFARQKTEDVRDQAQFNSAKDLIQELQISLQSDAKSLTRDLRFISELPPIEAIALMDGGNVLGHNAEDTQGVWQERLSSVFTAMLRGHESYLTIAYTTVRTDQVQEIVRSDRNRAGNWVRTVPESRLHKFEPSDRVEEWTGMKPGDVLLRATSQLTDNVPTQNRDGLVIVAGTPVFSEATGDLFGLVIIEMDLRFLFLEQLKAIGRESIEVLITDEKGEVLLRYLNGSPSTIHTGKAIAEILPETASLFDADSDVTTYSDGRTVLARRVKLNEASAQVGLELGVIVRLLD